MTEQDSIIRRQAAVKILSKLPKDQQATVWDYLMHCGADNPQLDKMRFQATLLAKEQYTQVMDTGCAIESLGKMLFRHIVSDSCDITECEAEGLAMAVQTLGDKVSDFADDIKRSGELILDYMGESVPVDKGLLAVNN